MTDFADLGMRIDSSSAAVAKRNLDALPASAAKAETSVSRLGASSERAGQQMRRGFGPGLQQAGYQIGDFAVQVASGQSALIALTQQGSQLLGAFGPMGAVIGAAGAVVGAMATAMLGASGSGQTLDKQLDDLDKTMARFRASTEAAAQSGAEMTEMFGSMAGAARDAAAAQAALDQRDSLKALSANIESITGKLDSLPAAAAGSFSEVADLIAQMNDQAKGAVVSVNDLDLALLDAGRADLQGPLYDLLALSKSLGVTIPQAAALAEGIAAIGRAKGTEDQTRAARALLNYMTQALGPVEKMPDAMAKIVDLVRAATKGGSDFVGTVENADGALSRAADRAERLTKAVEDAASAARDLAKSGLNDLATSDINFRYRDDPIARARALAGLEFDARVNMPSGMGHEPGLAQDIQRQRDAFIANAEAAEQNRQALSAWEEAQRGAARASRATVDAFERANASAQDRISQMRLDLSLVGQSEEAQLRLQRAYESAKLQAQLLTEARKTGNVVTAEEAAQVSKTIEAYDAAAASLDQATLAQKAYDQAAQDSKQAQADFVSAMTSSIQTADSVTDAIKRIILALVEMELRAAALGKSSPLKGIFGSLVGGIAGGVGGISFGGGAGITPSGSFVNFGSSGFTPALYADGTDFHPGGPAIVGENGEPELLDLPRGTKVTPMSKLRSIAGNPNVSINYSIDARGAGPREIDELRAEMRRQQRALPASIKTAIATPGGSGDRAMTRRGNPRTNLS